MSRRCLLFLFLIFSLSWGQDQTEKLPLEGVSICIDPGHGGSSKGAIGKRGFTEKEVNLLVSQRLTAYLREAGAVVYLTRDRDVEVPLKDRTDEANFHNCDRCISIHHNASLNRKPNYTATFVHPREGIESASVELAGAITSNLQQALEIRPGLGDISGELPGVKTANFHMVREARMPSVLVEISFLSNETEEARLRDSEYRDLSAQAIYLAILKLFVH